MNPRHQQSYRRQQQRDGTNAHPSSASHTSTIWYENLQINSYSRSICVMAIFTYSHPFILSQCTGNALPSNSSLNSTSVTKTSSGPGHVTTINIGGERGPQGPRGEMGPAGMYKCYTLTANRLTGSLDYIIESGLRGHIQSKTSLYNVLVCYFPYRSCWWWCVLHTMGEDHMSHY